MAESKNFTEAISGLDEIARAEAQRLWKMRKDIPEINEITLPILCLYCAAYSQARQLSLSFDEEDNDYDSTLDRLAKVQKIQLTYAKMLKLDETKKKKSNNKFADLLLGN